MTITTSEIRKHVHLTTLITFLLFPFFSSSALCQVTQPIEDQSWETWRDEVPLSGGVKVGLMLEDDQNMYTYESFFVNLPEDGYSNLCVEISSQDGSFEAMKAYDISNHKPGISEFALASESFAKLSEYKKGELVLLSSVRNNCDDEIAFYALSMWEIITSEHLVSIYLNSKSTPRIIGRVNGNVVIRIKCNPHKTERAAKSFNMKCEINDEIPPNTEFTIRLRDTVSPIEESVVDYPLPLKYH